PRISGQMRTVTSRTTCRGLNALTYDGLSGQLRTQLQPDAFLYFPGWSPDTADAAYDLDYDGQIDRGELRPYVSEYFNGRTGMWTTDLAQLQPGDIVHNFIDRNRNCKFDSGEPQSPHVQRRHVFAPWMFAKARALADEARIPYAAYVIWPGMDPLSAGGTGTYN